jgi:radical SAM superfamily enzyme YgiQ (UPF0313 family)
MREIISKHVSGHLKIAPEHLDNRVLALMRKNKAEDFFSFLEFFTRESRIAGREQYLVPYFISNFPGSGAKEFEKISVFLKNLKWCPQQVQDYIPLPMTIASAMYYCEKTPDGKNIFVNKGMSARRPQRNFFKSKYLL